MTPERDNERIVGREMFSRSEKSRNNPSPLRSSVKKPMPWRIASYGVLIFSDCPFNSIVPSFRRSTPNNPRMTSVRPAPIKPEKPMISPALTENETSSNRFPLACLTSRTVAPIDTSRSGYRSPISRPTISRTICSNDVSGIACVETEIPSRKTVIRSQSSKISSIRCEI